MELPAFFLILMLVNLYYVLSIVVNLNFSFEPDALPINRVATYLSIFVFAYFGYTFDFQRNSHKILVSLGILAWLGVALVQFFFDRSFLTGIANRTSSSFDRGVTSLAVEPSAYGLFMVMLIPFVILVFRKGLNSAVSLGWTLVGLLALQTIFLSQASTSVLALLILFGVMLLFTIRKHGRIILKFVLPVLFTGGLVVTYMGTSGAPRLSGVLKTIMNDPSQILNDASANERASHIYYSFAAALVSNRYPFGYNLFDQKMLRINQERVALPLFGENMLSSRPSSGLGGFIYEFGIFGVFVVSFWSCRFFKNKSLIVNSFGVSLPIILCLSVSMALPIFGIILGLNERALKEQYYGAK